MENYITDSARKYLKRMPQLVLDQINRLCQRLEHAEREVQRLEQELQHHINKDRQRFEGQQYGQNQPQNHMGFVYWPWGPYRQFFEREGQDIRNRGGRERSNRYDEDYPEYRYERENYDRRGFDTPYSARTYRDGENPNVTNAGQERTINPVTPIR